MPRNDSVGPSLVAFGRVVVDHVENHLDAGGVQVAHHRLELAHRDRSDRPASRSRGSGAKKPSVL